MKNALLLPLLLAFFCASCHKDKPEPCPTGLPCATQTGENTMGCYIDGQPWEAKVEPFVWDPTAHKINAHYDETDYQSFDNNYFFLLGIYQGVDIDSYKSVNIQFRQLTQIGAIFLDTLNFYRATYRNKKHEYQIDLNFPYKINITKLDTEKNIASGTFYFTGISETGLDTVRITDGRFDVKYDQY